MLPLLEWMGVGKLPAHGLAARGPHARDAAPRRHGRRRAGLAQEAVIAEFSTPLS
jgi:hypothetical protein